MTRDQAIKLILMRCGMRQNDKLLQAACVEEMQLAQQTKLERAGFKPWFLISETESTITMPFEERIPLPKGFLQEYEEDCLWIRPFDETTEDVEGAVLPPWGLVNKDDYDTNMVRRYGTNAPHAYAIVNNYIILTPTPQGTFSLKMKYYKAGALITADYGATEGATSNVWLDNAPDWLIGETGAVIAGQYIKDEATAAQFRQQAADARSAVMIEHTARDEANRMRNMGDD